LQRDLASPDLWTRSLERARTRRAQAEAQRRLERRARGTSVAALMAVAGGAPVAGAAAGKAVTGGGGGWAASIDAASQSAKVEAPPRKPATPSAVASGKAADPVRVASAGTSVSSTAQASTKPAAPEPEAAPATETASAPEQESTELATFTKAEPAGGVPELQRELGVAADGDFGATTERVLKRWQRRHGLTPDGVAGPQTREALGLGEGPVLKRERPAPAAKPRSRRPAAKRTSGADAPRSGGGVEALQRALGVPADGVFGPGTESALKRFQRRHGLAADGVAGPQTRQALGIGPGPVLKRKHASGGGSRGGSGGGSSSVVQRVIAAANAIATKPYRYGGGHGSFTDSGYDCSGSVSYALHGGGLLSSPLDSSAFMSYGRPGPGKHITIYANPGHVYMTIDGRRFDTSARSETGSRWTSTQRSSAGYTVRHPAGF
jgi:peptidoglycan hydrolase-like protein with peptidoglycan-binding domain